MPRTLLALVLAIAALAGAAHAQTIDIVPRPQSVTTGSGALVVVGPRTPIVTPSGDKAAARYLASLLQTTRGLALSVRSPATAHGAAIVFAHSDDSSLGREGYRLTIGDRRVRIEATTNAGLFYGAVSLWQLITAQSGQRGATLQPMTITDSPRFAWRGLLLDSARHYQSPAFIRRMIDWMALHKLNTLQWHLTDDQAWRLQIRKYPRLTSIGAWRTAPDRKTGKPVQYGGFYTQAEVRNLVAYAAARHVTIVPEIEMPGHSLSAIVAYPWLGVAKPDPATRGDWGIFPDILSPSERTYGFMTDVLSEVMALFPGPWINVGGDEAVKDEWRASPTVQAQIKTLGLANEDALQGWFTARIGGFIAAHGRRMIGWDDIMVGGAGLPADAATVSWHADGAARAVTAGHDTVIATDPILYFDHRQAELASEPTGRGAVVSLQDVYQSEPVPAAFAPADAAHIIGVQANLWTEHMRTQADVMQMAFPRAAAIAEVAWTQPARKDWPDFEERLPAEFTRYRGLGLAPDMGAVSVKLDAQRQDGGLEVTLSKQLQLGDIRYTLDGAVPTAASQAYAQPLTITSPAHLQAATFVDGHRVSPVLDRKIDPAAPERRLSQELTLCSQKVALNLDSVSDAQHGPYLVDIMNPCWTWPQADLTSGRKIEVAVTRLPFNFQLGADAAKIVLHPPVTPAGELEVRANGCLGAPIATLPLAPALRSNGDTMLSANLPPLPGRHDLCLSFTQRKLDPMWVVGWVSLR